MGTGRHRWWSSLILVQEEVIVGHAERGQKHRVLLKVDFLVAVLVQALHQVVNAALFHLLPDPDGEDRSVPWPLLPAPQTRPASFLSHGIDPNGAF